MHICAFEPFRLQVLISKVICVTYVHVLTFVSQVQKKLQTYLKPVAAAAGAGVPAPNPPKLQALNREFILALKLYTEP